MSKRQSRTIREDFASDVARSRRLQHRLRVQVTSGVLATAVIVGGLASIQFHSSRELSTEARLQQDLHFGALALGIKIDEYRSIAVQVTSRTYIRNLLAGYNRGEVALDVLRAESAPKLDDAIRLTPSMVGIRRYDAANRVVVEVGATQDSAVNPAEVGQRTKLGMPRVSARQARLDIGAPILNAEAERIGTDIVQFEIDDSFAIVERLAQQFDYPVQLAFASGDGSLFRLGSQGVDRPGQLLSRTRLDQLVGKASDGGDGILSIDDHTLVVSPIPNSDWKLLFIAETDAITRELRTDSWFLFAAIMLLTLAGMAITRLLIKPTVGRILIGERKLEALYRRNQQLLEQKLKNSRLLDGVINGTSAVIFVKDLEGRYLLANQAYADERQMARKEIIGKTDFDFHSAEIARELRANDLRAIEKGEQMVVEEQVEVKGETRWFVTTKVPLKDMDDRVYATCGLATDVTELKRTEELRFALEKAEAANTAKTTFLANMSHELRTPMHGILSYADLGSKRIDHLDRKKLGQYFENIHLSGIRLLDLLNDLLDLSKLEAGKYEMVYRKIYPGEILEECLIELAPMIEARSLEIGKPVDAGEYVFDGDRGKILQVLRNLLSNAVKFSPPQGRIDIEFGSCHLRSGDLHLDGFEISLVDDGKGIAAEELDKVFDKFYQSGKSRVGGTGLGLSICREIVLLHQGEISATNCPGRGARFTVRLPRSNPRAVINKMRAV